MNKNITSKIKEISLNCDDPIVAYRKMRGTLDSAGKYIRKVVVRNMFSVMIKKEVGTNEVEAAAKRVEGRSQRRNKKEVVRIMKKRLRWIQKEIKYLKYVWYRQQSELNRLIKRNMNYYYEVERSVKDKEWLKCKQKCENKVKHIVLKIQKQNSVRQNQNYDNAYTFYKWSDKDLEDSNTFLENNSEAFIVYGNVRLSEEEKRCLSLGPKFMETPPLKKQDFEVELELGCIKTRMELIKQSEVEEEEDLTEEALKKHEEDERDSRSVFNQNTGILQMSKQRVSDAKYNTRSFPPRLADVNDELIIQNRRNEILKAFNSLKNSICDKRGKQSDCNMSREEQKGKASLKNRIENKEIIVTMTDKSGKFAVIDPITYREAAQIHLKDKLIPDESVKDIEMLLNRHALQIVKALRMGTQHGTNGQEARVRQAYTSVNGQPGPMYFLIKDHKAVKEGETIPPTRPVCSAKGGPGSRLSNLLSTMLNSAADAKDAETECMSTEEALRVFLESNREIKRRSEEEEYFKEKVKDMVLLSMDVKALYPSLKVKEVGPIIYEVIHQLLVDGKFTIEDVDWHEIGKYLAIVCDKEKLTDLQILTAIPTRTVGDDAPGRKPGPAYWDNDEVKVNGIKMQKWVEARSISIHQEKRMLTQMIVSAVITSMNNHMYRFDGHVYKQEDGGPIGDELSQAVARIVMIWWDQKFLNICRQLKLDILFYFRYVDDTNKAIIPPPPGVRYIDGELVIIQECIEQDKEVNSDTRVGKLLCSIANSISPMLQFEEDVCSNHAEGRLPILDLKVWKEVDDEGSTIIKHEFYKKPMANKATITASTAYPTSKIRAVMVEEILRRLRNCSPESSWTERGEHLTEFARCLKSSGHSEHFRKIVFQKAVAKFQRELKDHMSGVKDIYRTREQRRQDVKDRGGKNDKDSWFRIKDNKTRIGSIIKVPYTRRSQLRNKVDEVVKKYSQPDERVKIAVKEDGGRVLRNELFRPDPFKKDRCYREDCPVQIGNGHCRETCFQAHINYAIHCEWCRTRRQDSDGQDSSSPDYVYIGETSRGCYNRFKQHQAAYRVKEGFMWDHAEGVHSGAVDVKYGMKVEARDSDPMRRVVRESIRISEMREREGNEVVLLNGKDEWFGFNLVNVNFTLD